MAIQHLDMTGKTTDEAIAKALTQLGLDRDDVSVEILDQGKKGFFGLGAAPAKVRITYGLEDAPAVPNPPSPPVPPPAAPVHPARPERPQPPARPPRPERSEHPERPERKKFDKPRPERHSQTPRPVQEVSAPPEEELGEICNDEKAQKIVAFLTGLLEHMGHPAQVLVYQPEEGRYKVILECEKPSQLIGHHGETLDAIQQLTNYSVNRSGEKRVRIHVDTGNYRFNREQALQSDARKAAAKVLRNRRNVTLRPMNAYERHVIHTALQDMEGITTYSMGTDPNRRVIVAYNPGGQDDRQK